MGLREATDGEGAVRGPLDRSLAEELARTLRALADPTRIQILSIIAGSPGGEATVQTITDGMGLRQPTISYHLRIMLEDGHVLRDQRGRNVWYSIAPDRRDTVHDLLG